MERMVIQLFIGMTVCSIVKVLPVREGNEGKIMFAGG
jgi:hypothetical protein